MRPQFRSYFQNVIDMMLNQKETIYSFIEKCGKKSTKKKTLRNNIFSSNKTRRQKK
jgi:hypothetical protein